MPTSTADCTKVRSRSRRILLSTPAEPRRNKKVPEEAAPELRFALHAAAATHRKYVDLWRGAFKEGRDRLAKDVGRVGEEDVKPALASAAAAMWRSARARWI